ncbi:hypothetical protein ACFODZ_03885 [Marinicella sediminis]|uniref:Uncharacterized protein n=1 Tax=Marinicella sediminis TaxID=1792834 RepID=A0ABV7J5M8_9GAMM|nr:hypothetical protein [Marinicella sediminis]
MNLNHKAMALLIIMHPWSSFAECVADIHIEQLDHHYKRGLITVLERGNPNPLINSAEVQANQSITTTIPDQLLKTIDVVIHNTGSDTDSELTFLYVWPCDQTSTVLHKLKNSTGSASEVRSLWNSDSMNNPEDVNAAALSFAKALSSALERHHVRPNGQHQYDLISTYMVLKSFEQYAEMSKTPLALSQQLRMFANKLLRQLDNRAISRHNLSEIEEQGKRLASRVLYQKIYYLKTWNQISAFNDPLKKHQLLVHFYDSIDSESDSPELLNHIGQTLESIMNLRAKALNVLQTAQASANDISKAVQLDFDDNRELIKEKMMESPEQAEQARQELNTLYLKTLKQIDALNDPLKKHQLLAHYSDSINSESDSAEIYNHIAETPISIMNQRADALNDLNTAQISSNEMTRAVQLDLDDTRKLIEDMMMEYPHQGERVKQELNILQYEPMIDRMPDRAQSDLLKGELATIKSLVDKKKHDQL